MENPLDLTDWLSTQRDKITHDLNQRWTDSPEINSRELLLTRRNELLQKRYSRLSSIEPHFARMLQAKIDWNDIEPQMIFVDNQTEKDLWFYARNVVCSFPDDGVIGKTLRCYVVDKKSGRWLGIVLIGESLLAIKCRDDLVGWTEEVRLRRLQQIVNIAICVPLQPFGLLTGGKLLALSVLSNECQQRIGHIWKQRPLAVEVTSLWGRGSQYNRLKEFQYLGETGGFGGAKLNQADRRLIGQFFELTPEKDIVDKGNMHSRLTKRTNKLSSVIGTKSPTAHGQPRGYYWAPTAENSHEVLTGIDGEPRYFTRPFEILVNNWMDRWYRMRLPKKQAEVDDWSDSAYLLSSVFSDHSPQLQIDLD